MLRFFIFAVLSLSIINSQGYYLGDSLVQEGVDAFYNYEFDSSIEILNQAREQYPNHPGVHLIWATSRWVRSQANDAIEQTYIILENDLSTIEPIYEELILKNPNDPNYRLYYGSAVGLKARVSMGKKEWLKTLYRSYKGFSLINEISNSHPEIVDVQLPIGIVEYYSGISNALLRWTINIMGLDPSIESGLDKITDAANNGRWSWIEAKAIICNLYLWVEDDPILALPHARELAYHFPKNYWFNLLYLESLIRTSKIDDAYDLMKKMDRMLGELTKRQKTWYGPYQEYEKALLHFYKKDYEKTLKFVSETIENYSGELDVILGNAFLLQGMAHDKLNQRDEAKVSYKNCIDVDNFSSAMVKAKKYLERTYSEI